MYIIIESFIIKGTVSLSVKEKTRNDRNIKLVTIS
jgi:hypothetical protein